MQLGKSYHLTIMLFADSMLGVKNHDFARVISLSRYFLSRLNEHCAIRTNGLCVRQNTH
jgi:hypothetical protein